MNDFRFGVRMLARNPGSTGVITGLLALGIGSATVIFSVFDAVLLRPLPVRHPEELVRVVQRLPKIGAQSAFPYAYYQTLRDHSSTLASVFGDTAGYFHFAMTEPSPAEQVIVDAVTPEFFEALGVPAVYGRTLTPDDEGADSGLPPVVLSYGFWKRRFAGDPRVAEGWTLGLLGHRVQIVGVMPRDFNGLTPDTAPDIRIPWRAFLRLTGFQSVGVPLELAGRLKAGFARAPSEAECLALWRSTMGPYFRDIERGPAPIVRQMLDRGVALDPLERGVSVLRDRFGDVLQWLMASVMLLLLIACSNVAGLLLARATARRREIAVRLAVGATRGRLVRQSLVENSLLAALGAGGGILIARAAMPLATRALPPMRNMATTLLPLSIGLSIDRRVLAFSVVLSVLTLMLFSLAPAMATARSSLDSILRGVRSSSSMRGRQALIVVQIALCTFLLAFAGLFVRTFQQLRGMDPGFDRDHVATFTVDLMGWTGFETKAEAALREALTTRVRQIPCVVSAATSARGVMRGRGLGNTIVPEGHSLKPGDFLNTSVNTVSPEYFDTMGMSILAGRGLTPRDVPADSLTSRASVVVNRAFAQRFFPGVDPVGKHFGPSTDTRRNEIVGVVSDAKYRSLREPIPPTFYSVVEWGYGSFVLNVRTRVRPESIFEPVRKALAATDPSVAFLEIHTLADEVDASTASERLTAALASIFGAIAALLVGVGIYGLLAYAVAQRKREIGIRMALGARLADIRGLIGRQVCLMVACGVAAGILGALMAGKWIGALLYGVSPHDPASLALSALFVALVSVAASVLPSHRATHVDPAKALREDN
jgi:predicted permease